MFLMVSHRVQTSNVSRKGKDTTAQAFRPNSFQLVRASAAFSASHSDGVIKAGSVPAIVIAFTIPMIAHHPPSSPETVKIVGYEGIGQ